MKRKFLTINQWRTYRRPDEDADAGTGGGDDAEIAKMSADAANNKGADLATATEIAKGDKAFVSEENQFKADDLHKEDESAKSAEEILAEKKVVDEKKLADKKAADEKKKSDAEKNKGKTAEQIASDKKVADDAARASKSKDGEDVDDDDTVLKVMDVPTDEGNEESNWKTVGKELGFEVPEDTFEAFKKAEAEFWASKQTQDDASRLDAEIESLDDPEAKELLSFVKNGGKLRDFINPMKEYDELLALGDEALVRQYLTLNKWDEKKIDERIAGLKENGTLETEAYPLRKSLENGKETKKNELFTSQQKLSETQNKSKADAKIKEDNQIIAALSKVKEFQGKKVTPEVTAALTKKWNTGFYRERFAKDPDFVANVILNYELSEQVKQAAVAKAHKEGLHKNQDKLHNIVKNTEEMGSRSTKAVGQSGGEGDFSSWKTELESA